MRLRARSRLLFVLIVGVLSVLLGWRQPKLDLEAVVYPLAHEFMGLTAPSPTPLNGLVVVITGATSGIGKSLTRALSEMGATVIAIGRSKQKLESLRDEMTRAIPIVADLSDLSSVARAGEQILNEFPQVDVLVNNAGMHYARTGERRPPSAQNYDQSFVVNYLSHFLLSEKLLPSLNKSNKATIVQISSSFHWAVDGNDLVEVKNKPPAASVPGGLSGVWRDQRAYANSKLAQLLHARAMARQNVTTARVVSACPAWVGTDIAGENGSLYHFIMNTFAFPSDGWGLASVLQAILEKSDADFYTNSRVFFWFTRLIPKWFFRSWTMSTHVRDVSILAMSVTLLYLQKFSADASPDRSSPESYDRALQDWLYRWSKTEMAAWL